VKSAVIVPGRAPQWIENHARHVAQRLTSTGRVLVAFTHTPALAVSLPGQTEQSSLFGHSVSGYPLWMGRVSAVLGLRRRSHDTVLVLWNGANGPMAAGAALVSRLRRERLTVDIAEPPREVSMIGRMCRKLVHSLAHNVVGIRPESDGTGEPCLVVALCGTDSALAQTMVQSFDAMSDETARRWELLVQVARSGSNVLDRHTRRDRKVSLHVGEIPMPVLWDADVVVAGHRSPVKNLVTEAVRFGGVGIIVGGPVSGRVLRQPDGVWLAKQECAALIVALEASSIGATGRPHSIGTMRVLGEDVVALVWDEATLPAA
jgi:hypothetical protein